jgi:HSP20 family molecular chaperone IbpA
MELEYGPFQRRVSLAEDVDPDCAEAHYERGQLTIVMPLARKPAVGRVLIVLGERQGEQ